MCSKEIHILNSSLLKCSLGCSFQAFVRPFRFCCCILSNYESICIYCIGIVSLFIGKIPGARLENLLFVGKVHGARRVYSLFIGRVPGARRVYSLFIGRVPGAMRVDSLAV